MSVPFIQTSPVLVKKKTVQSVHNGWLRVLGPTAKPWCHFLVSDTHQDQEVLRSFGNWTQLGSVWFLGSASGWSKAERTL